MCVPGLGSFTAVARPASYDAGEETMLPPVREVRWDERECDGGEAVIQAVGEVYGLTAEEAEAKLKVWVRELFDELSANGQADFGSIGSFANEGEGIVFTASQSGVTAPDYYALDAVHVREIERKEPAGTPVISTDSKHITISLNKAFATYVAAACIALVLFFSLGSPVGNTQAPIERTAEATAQFIPAHLLPCTMTVSEDTPETTALDEASEEAESAEAEEAVTEEAEGAVAEAKEAPYCIVVASSVPRKNAEAYVKILRGRGFETARIIEGKVLRVAVGAYETEREAYNAARALHRQSDEYFYAWVYAIK